MRLNFKGKWVLITGASSGLGREMCKELVLKHQANVIITARSYEKLVALKNELNAQSISEIEIVTADLSKKEDIERLYKMAIKSKNLYAAILNAGISLIDFDKNIGDEDVDKLIDTNIRSTVYLSKYIINHFCETENNGGILYVSSLSTFYPTPLQALYSGSKSFINNYVLAISEEYKNKQFSLSIFTPGGIKTEMVNDEKLKHLDKWLVEPEKVAKIAIDGFMSRKLIYASKFSIEIFLSKFIPTKMKLFWSGKLYKI
jgi:uncharacterized protein